MPNSLYMIVTDFVVAVSGLNPIIGFQRPLVEGFAELQRAARGLEPGKKEESPDWSSHE